MKSILLIKKIGGLVEMTFGSVNASFSLPEWQAVKNDFLCTLAGIKCNSPMIVSARSLLQFTILE